jgi:copper resistance protein B
MMYILSMILWWLMVASVEAQEHIHDTPPTWYKLTAKLEEGTKDDASLFDWEIKGSIGNDVHRFKMETKGDVLKTSIMHSEVWGLYNRTISEFWNIQGGIRQDIEPEHQTFGVLGIDGMAINFIETEANAFLSDTGMVTMRLEQEIDVPITQKLVTQPHVEVNVSVNGDKDNNTGDGINDIEIGLETRYQLTRFFAPYIDIRYKKLVGETAVLAKQQQDDTQETTLRIGVAFRF